MSHLSASNFNTFTNLWQEVERTVFETKPFKLSTIENLKDFLSASWENQTKEKSIFFKNPEPKEVGKVPSTYLGKMTTYDIPSCEDEEYISRR